MHELNRQAVLVKPFNFMEETPSRHKRSLSDPAQGKIMEGLLNNRVEASRHVKVDMEQLKQSAHRMQRQSPNTEAHNSLKQEILQLQKGLQDQVVARHALEKALCRTSFPFDATSDNSMPKRAEELIKEIATLELEVVYLERYLLSLYQKQFGRTLSSIAAVDEKLKPSSMRHSRMATEDFGHEIESKKESTVTHTAYDQEECSDIWGTQELLDSSVRRTHSSISQQSVFSHKPSPPRGVLAEAANSYHSLPLSMLERVENASSGTISIRDHSRLHISGPVPNTPNLLSEEMIKCISAIYCKLAEPPLICHDTSSPPMSLSSSMGEFSPKARSEVWSSPCRKKSFQLVDPFNNEGSPDFSGPYCRMVEVQWIHRDSKKLGDVEQLLRKFRELISQLEAVDLGNMKHHDKLAFWINVHNALAMHAFLVYGIPKNNLKRFSLLLKAAYNVGGHAISIDMIQNSILGCRLPRPEAWFHFLLPSKMKFKAQDEKKGYAIEHPEPRLHFALCSGSHSDPPVRVYTPKQVFQELEVAKEEYIQTTASLLKDQKIVLPKLVKFFAKELGSFPAGFFEMIEPFMPYNLRRRMQQHCRGKLLKSTEWTPHNFSFRYLFSKELLALSRS